MTNYSTFHYHLRTFGAVGSPKTDSLFEHFNFARAEEFGRKLVERTTDKVRVQRCNGGCFIRAHSHDIVTDGQPLEIVFLRG